MSSGRRSLLALSLAALSLLGTGCGGSTGGSTSNSTASTSTARSTPTATPAVSPPGAIVSYVNQLRALGNLPAVAEDASLSQGLAMHANYMVKNNVVGHFEDPSTPFYTPEGDLAAKNSNVFGSSAVDLPDTKAIDFWITGPFHAAGILDAKLTGTGFSSAALTDGGVQYGACLDVLRGRGSSVAAGVTFPVLWPGNGQTVGLTRFPGSESPDPLTSCPGYVAPTGLPIYVLLGSGSVTPQVTGSSLVSNGVTLEHVVFDETSYVNPDPETQSTGRSVLGARDMVVMMPRQPLTPGASYAVSLTVNGATISWTFAVSATASGP